MISAPVGRDASNVKDDVRIVQRLLNIEAAHRGGSERLVVDGLFGPMTAQALDDAAYAMGYLLPTTHIDRHSALLWYLLSHVQPRMGTTLLRLMLPTISERRIDSFAPLLQACMARYDIRRPRRVAHFLAQIAHESNGLQHTEELASGAAYEGRTDLGNRMPGDGQRFKGRGLIQLTGRANYQAYSEARGIDLVTGDGPQRLADDLALATDVAGWFWQESGLNQVADRDDLTAITKRINGGTNGLASRRRYFRRAEAILLRAHSLLAFVTPSTVAAASSPSQLATQTVSSVTVPPQAA